MPSPFPGMDPYLESPHWAGFQVELIAEIARQLTRVLRPSYVALIVRGSSDGYEAAQATVELQRVADRKLITSIEVLVPANKCEEEQLKFLARRRMLLKRGVNLVEIDLLRAGKGLPIQSTKRWVFDQLELLRAGKPLPTGFEIPAEEYLAYVSRVTQPSTCAFSISLRERLPVLPIPLDVGPLRFSKRRDDATLDLQAAVSAVYDDYGYDLIADYARPPAIELPPDDAVWAMELLRAAGRRTA